ncbi:hypothetical protein C6P45_001234 [Maudiozyma exigua]|uniref:Protein Ste5 Fus3-binding domain-containing protein n=1 Tax=Maudiozyma exigua TaxID=34358 RepID=A0A9P6W405_MAUEX|nr:hypothetical protein C6P45_001234 [Kazachstania exigua]
MPPPQTDDYIYSLTNINGYTKDRHITTANKNSKKKEWSDNHSPSPKRWADKLLNFQLNSRKGKIPAPITPAINSSISLTTPVISSPIRPDQTFPSPHTPVEATTPTDSYPSRVSSLPRPISSVSSKSNTRVSPINSSHSEQNLASLNWTPREGVTAQRSKSKKSFLTAKCTICDEPISHRSHGERIVELQCGHLCHQDCLMISFGDISTSSTNIYELFPPCIKCKVDKSVNMNCVPKDEMLKDRIISDVFLTKVGNVSSPVSSYGSTPINHSASSPMNRKTPDVVGQTVNINTLADIKMVRPATQLGTAPRSVSPQLLNYDVISTKANRYDLINQDKNILHTLPVFDETNIAEEISIASSSYHDDEARHQEISNIMLSTKFVSLEMYYPVETIKVNVVSDSILQCEIITEKMPKLFELSESPFTNSTTALQKWASALLNSNIIFDHEAITSTLRLPPIIKNMGNDGDVLTTYTADGSSRKISEVGTIGHIRGSVIIRRQPKIADDTNIDNGRSSIYTTKTSVSTLISLRRKKPDNLILVLQIDKQYMVSKDAYTIVFNNLKALEILFPSLYICLLDSKMMIQQQGPVSKVVVCKNDLKIRASSERFTVLNLKRQIQKASEISDRSVGIAVVSNATMSKDVNILFSSFELVRKFHGIRTNVLKIKIGYLYMNYTEEIDELAEIDSWPDMLELLCYTFAIDYDSDDEEESELSDFDNSLSITPSSIIDDITSSDDSILTLNIMSTSFDSDMPANNESHIDDSEIFIDDM